MDNMLIWNIVLTFVVLPIGWWANQIASEVKRLNILLNMTRENYVKREDHSGELGRVVDHLVRLEAKIDNLVLGCTHYHFLIPVLKKLLPEGITIIESGPAVAKQTKAILEKYNLLNSSQQSVNYSFFTNGSTGVMANLMNLEKRTIKKLD